MLKCTGYPACPLQLLCRLSSSARSGSGHGDKNSRRAYLVSVASISRIQKCSQPGLSRARNGHLVYAALLPLKRRDNVRLRTAPKSFLTFKDFCRSARRQFGL